VTASSDLRALCQTLLNGSPDRGTLQTVEDFIKTALLGAQGQQSSPELRLETWTPVDAPNVADLAERRSLLLALSPSILLEGAWLARVSQPATGHLSAHGHLFAIYGRMIGLDDASPPLPQHFRTLLTSVRVSLPPLFSPSFFNDRRFPDFALHMPCLHLGLMHRPRTFFPELLGYTLGHCFLDSAWWASLADQRDTSWISARERFSDDVRPLASAALESYLREHDDSERIRAGWHLYRRMFESLLTDFSNGRNRRPTTVDAMADIVRTKRPYAVAYHRRVMLQERPLDQWLAEIEDDPGPLLEALRNSPYVDFKCPAAGRLIRAMDIGGSMFGVFTAAERRLCLDWVENPDAEAKPIDASGTALGPVTALCAEQNLPSARDRPKKPMPSRHTANCRRLFTTLLRTESASDCPPEATIAVERILRRSRWLDLLRPIRRSLRHYDPKAFSQWIEATYRQEAMRYRPLNGNPKIRREFCLWAILQLVPSILVDGCWLAGVPTASENLGEVELHLLQIYADEVGKGEQEQNHANVYRRLLESLDLAVPGVETEDFAQDRRLTDAAFELPVYMLAVGLLKDRYFPELLGLNLAIELSGLGAGYMQVVDILRYYGIDPTIIQLHQTIDNLASGHAGRARDAILLYLDRIRQQSDLSAVQLAWHRIRLGYVSLHIAVLPLTGRFMQRYFGDRLKAAYLTSRTAG